MVQWEISVGRVRIQSAVLDILGFHLPAYSFLFAIGIEIFLGKAHL